MARRKPIYTRVAARVKAAGLSYADLSRKTGWHELRALRVLTGKTELTAADMELLAEILDCEVGELYRGLEATGS